MPNDQDPPQQPPQPQAPEQAGPPEQQQIVIEIDWSDEPTPVYSNGAQILNSQREFAVVFTDFVGFAGRGNASSDQPPKAKIVSNVRMTPDVFFQLAAACASNWNKFVNRFGDPQVRSPKFKIIGGGSFQLEGLEPPGSADGG
jgi:hypothetical protein